jgi:hypothetical protein
MNKRILVVEDQCEIGMDEGPLRLRTRQALAQFVLASLQPRQLFRKCSGRHAVGDRVNDLFEPTLKRIVLGCGASLIVFRSIDMERFQQSPTDHPTEVFPLSSRA